MFTLFEEEFSLPARSKTFPSRKKVFTRFTLREVFSSIDLSYGKYSLRSSSFSTSSPFALKKRRIPSVDFPFAKSSHNRREARSFRTEIFAVRVERISTRLLLRRILTTGAKRDLRNARGVSLSETFFYRLLQRFHSTFNI